jgi:hypothetical protein
MLFLFSRGECKIEWAAGRGAGFRFGSLIHQKSGIMKLSLLIASLFYFMKNQKGFVSAAVLIAIVLGLIVLGGGAYYVVHQQSSSQATTEIQPSNSTTETTVTNTNPTPAPTSQTVTPPKNSAAAPSKTTTTVTQTNTLDLSHQYSYRDVMDNVSVLTADQLKTLVAQSTTQPNEVVASVLLLAPNLTATQRQSLVDVLVASGNYGTAVEALQAQNLTPTQRQNLLDIVVTAMKSSQGVSVDKVFSSPGLTSSQIQTLFDILVNSRDSVNYIPDITDVFARFAAALSSTQRQTLFDIIIKQNGGHASVLISDSLQSSYLTDSQRQTLVDMIIADKDVQGISYIAKAALKAPNLTASQQSSLQTIEASGK